MYAVIVTGGKQYRVAEGATLKLEKLTADVGSSINFDQLLMVGEGENFHLGGPLVEGGLVSATVLRHGRAKKIKIIKMRRRKNSRRQAGHRQSFTEVKIEAISAGGGSKSKPKAVKAKKPVAEEPAAEGVEE